MQEVRPILRREFQLNLLAYAMIVALAVIAGLLGLMVLTGLRASDLWLLKNQLVQILGMSLLVAAIAYMADTHRRLRRQLGQTHDRLTAAQEDLTHSYDHVAFAHYVAGEVVAHPGAETTRRVLRESTRRFGAEAAAVVAADVQVFADDDADMETVYPLALNTALESAQSGSHDLFMRSEDGYEIMAAPLRIRGHLQAVVCLMRRGRAFSEEDAKGLELVARVLELGIHNQLLLSDTRRQVQGVLTALSTLVADRQSGYRTHAAEVANLSVAVGAAHGMTEQEVESLRHASLLHDVGLLSVPVELINTGRPVTEEERETVQSHAAKGAELARGANFDETVQQAILAHHERLDGTGYPSQLKGLEIPLAARIIAVCDSYDAMTHERPNTQRLRPFEALAEIRSGAGSSYDPKIVNSFVKIIEQRVQLAKVDAASA